MATISQIAHPMDPAMLKNNSPISPPPFDRCNSSPSSASSSSSSASLDQQRVKPRQTVGKRFLVSRVQQHLANCPWPEELAEGQQPEEMQEQEEEEELISFRYNWPVRISERLVGANESAILNVSPPFCTAYNGVQFTWLLRICEENILDLDFGCSSSDGTLSARGEWEQPRGKKKVNITLYYKEGPARDVKLHSGNISIRNSKGVLFEEMPLRELEYTKGGGWSPICAAPCGTESAPGQRKFSEFIHAHVGRHISVRVKLEMPARLFQPLQYLPSIDSPISGQLEALSASVLDQIRSHQLLVPDAEFFDPKTDKYALYRHVYQFGCREIFQRFTHGKVEPENAPELMEKIQNIFAHFYFNNVIVPEAECFEDFLEALDASRHIQFPALRRECERYICAEVMAESADLTLVKKVLLLAERFELRVLKMVSFGVIVDRLLLQQPDAKNTADMTMGQSCKHSAQKSTDSGSGTTIESSMEEIREELLEIAEQIIHPTEHNQSANCSSIGQLQTDENGHPKARRVHSKSLCSPKRLSTGSSGGNSADEEADFSSDDEEDEDEERGGETLVGSVIAQLEELARHIRKVSMPPGVRPAPSQNGRPNSPEIAQKPNSPKWMHGGSSTDSGHVSTDSRRSSLKTGRDLLQQQRRPERSSSSNSNGLALGNDGKNPEKSPSCARKSVQFVTRFQQVEEDIPQRKNAVVPPEAFSPLFVEKQRRSVDEDEGVEGDLLAE